MSWRQWTDCYIDPKFFFDHSSTSFSSWLGLLNCGSLRAAKPSVYKLVLTLLAYCLQLTQAVCALVILLFNVHILPMFFRLFTQAHLLIDGSVVGQYITRLNLIVFVKVGRWPYISCFVGCYLQDLFNIACSILVELPSSFFSIRLVSVRVVHPYRSIDTTAARKKNCVLCYRSDLTSI